MPDQSSLDFEGSDVQEPLKFGSRMRDLGVSQLSPSATRRPEPGLVSQHDAVDDKSPHGLLDRRRLDALHRPHELRAGPSSGAIVAEQLQDHGPLDHGQIIRLCLHGKVRPFRATPPAAPTVRGHLFTCRERSTTTRP